MRKIVKYVVIIISFVVHIVCGDISELCSEKTPIASALSNAWGYQLFIKGSNVWYKHKSEGIISGPESIEKLFRSSKINSIDASFHIYPDDISAHKPSADTMEMTGLAFIFSGQTYYVFIFVNKRIEGLYAPYELKKGVPFGLKAPSGPISDFKIGQTIRRIDAAVFNRKTYELMLIIDTDVYVYPSLKAWTASPPKPVKKRMTDVFGFSERLQAAMNLDNEDEVLFIFKKQFCEFKWSEKKCKKQLLSKYFGCHQKPKDLRTTKKSNKDMSSTKDMSTSEQSNMSSEDTGKEWQTDPTNPLEPKALSDSKWSGSKWLIIGVVVVVIIVITSLLVWFLVFKSKKSKDKDRDAKQTSPSKVTPYSTTSPGYSTLSGAFKPTKT